MFTVLQRMDDCAARHAGAAASPRALRPLALLAAPGMEALEALEEWSSGQEWIQALFSSHRRLLPGLHFLAGQVQEGLYPRASLERGLLEKKWRMFCQTRLPDGLADALLDAWRAAEDAAALCRFDNGFAPPASENARSLEAGRLLMERTHGALHQGALGRYRAFCAAGSAPGHFIAAWAAVARFFQLSLGTYLTEYLRLEWDTARQGLRCGGRALELEELAELASRIMRGSPSSLALLDAPVTGPRASSAGESPGALP